MGSSMWGVFLLLQSVRLTAACRVLAQLQPIDGQSVSSSTLVALLSFALHIAFALWSIGCLDFVATVALCSELQTRVHVTSGGKWKEKGLASLVKEDRKAQVIVLSIHYALILHRPAQIDIQGNWISRNKQMMHRGCWSTDENTSKHYNWNNISLSGEDQRNHTLWGKANYKYTWKLNPSHTISSLLFVASWRIWLPRGLSDAIRRLTHPSHRKNPLGCQSNQNPYVLLPLICWSCFY